jgi:hypothetical protein
MRGITRITPHFLVVDTFARKGSSFYGVLRSEIWLEQKRAKRKVFGKPAAAGINTAAVAVHTAGNEIIQAVRKNSDESFIKGLRFFYTGFLY